MKHKQSHFEANFKQTVGCEINLHNNSFAGKGSTLELYITVFCFFHHLNILLMSDRGPAYQLNIPRSPCQLHSLFFHQTHSILTSQLVKRTHATQNCFMSRETCGGPALTQTSAMEHTLNSKRKF